MTATKRTTKPAADNAPVVEEEASEEIVSTPSDDAPAEVESSDATEGVEVAEEVKPKRQNFSHMNCTHERSKKARAACRRARARTAAAASTSDAEAEEPTEG